MKRKTLQCGICKAEVLGENNKTLAEGGHYYDKKVYPCENGHAVTVSVAPGVQVVKSEYASEALSRLLGFAERPSWYYEAVELLKIIEYRDQIAERFLTVTSDDFIGSLPPRAKVLIVSNEQYETITKAAEILGSLK